jgi:hypothetical protein
VAIAIPSGGRRARMKDRPPVVISGLRNKSGQGRGVRILDRRFEM